MLIVKAEQDNLPLSNSRCSTQNPNTDRINIKEVLSKIDLISLAQEYGLDLVPQTNGDYIAFCPFHPDVATMSLRFYIGGTFHCFGCHAGSSAIDFVMRIEGIAFKDALSKLAGKVGYSSLFDLRDIHIPNKVNNDIRITREHFETASVQKAREVFFRLKRTGLIPLKDLFEKFEDLWQGYDKNQRIFNKKQFNLKFLDDPLIILYRMYEAFIQKLSKLEKELNPFK